MRNKEFIKQLNTILNNPKIKSIKVIDWKECGEFAGEDPRPIITIEKFKEEGEMYP